MNRKPLAALLFASLFWLLPLHAAEPEFDGWQRTSVYVPVRDGVRLAVDYYRPSKAGKLHLEPLPVVWRFTPYARYRLNENGVIPDPNALPSRGAASLNNFRTLQVLLQHGYIVADVDMRGFAASFGVNDGWLGPQDAADAHDITEWFAVQPWSTGKVGMTGMSYLGGVQYLAMTQASPHLKAIFAGMAQWDHYGAFYLNGVYRPDLGALWRPIRYSIDYPAKQPLPNSVSPVGADEDRSLLQAAVRDHYWNRDAGEQSRALRYRDSVDPVSGRKMNIDRSFWRGLEAANRSGVAVYHLTGWYDHGGLHQLLAFANLQTPQKILVGPYFHRDHFGFDVFGEQLRWFDYWLKSIDNGIMDEPPVRYFVAGQRKEIGWKTAPSWPLPNEQRRKWYFSKGGSGSVESVNDGRLLGDQGQVQGGKDRYETDYGISLGGYAYVARNNGVFRTQCWGKEEAPDECYAGSGFPDLSLSYDARSLTYTSDPLQRDLTVTGHPVVRFWASASDGDADFFVVLEEVEPNGKSNYVSYYAIKGSHRTLNEAPFDHLGLPWQGNYEADITPMTDQPVEIELALNPIANLFDEGNRFRVTIAGTDELGGTEPGQKPVQTITIHYGKPYPSHLELPVVAD